MTATTTGSVAALRAGRLALLGVLACCCTLLLFGASTVTGFYIPGAPEVSYKSGADVVFWMNSLRSSSELFPVDYNAMPFCFPNKKESKRESIGEIIWGDRQYRSAYRLKMLSNVTCMVTPDCDAAKNTELIAAQGEKLKKMINQLYRAYMNIDNLPAFTNSSVLDGRMMACANKLGKDAAFVHQRGWPLGIPAKCSTNKEVLLNNHLAFVVHYNYDSKSSATSEEKSYIVVGVTVEAASIAWGSATACTEAKDLDTLKSLQPLKLDSVIKKESTVHWTYSFSWVPSTVKWGTRWDLYLTSAAASKPGNHILSIVLSTTIVFFIGSSVFCLLLRALHKDFNRYNSEDPEDLQEETGWKLIHADVFRPPFYANWLAIFVANGCQIICTVAIVLVVALLGFLSPSRRGSLVSALLFTAISTSIIGGYVCGALLQYLNCRAWKHIFMCSLTLPGGVFLMYLFLSVVNKAHHATTAVPFTTLLQIFLLVGAVSLPLTVLGASIAFRQQPMSNPTRVGRLAREVPNQSVLNQPVFMFTFFPCVPLIVAVIELCYIMQDLWAGQIYYSFGFLSLTAVIWVLACALVTISCLYYVLCYENHRWWWIAYVVPGGAGAHMFLLAVFFYLAQMSDMSFASTLLFFSYMGLVAYMYGMAAGAIGLITSIAFVRRIYASIKID